MLSSLIPGTTAKDCHERGKILKLKKSTDDEARKMERNKIDKLIALVIRAEDKPEDIICNRETARFLANAMTIHEIKAKAIPDRLT